MADKSMSVRVVGLREVNAALKQLGEEMPKAMQKALWSIAAPIAGRIQRKVPSGPTGRASSSVQPQATSRGAALVAGGSQAPYFQWLDFGGTVGRGHKRGYNMGAIHREWLGKPVGSGRYIYPTIEEAKPETIAALDEAVKALAQSGGFETSGEL